MRRAFLILVLLATAGPAAPAQPARLKVGIFDRPPFAMRDEGGQWTGLAVELWETIAVQLGLSYEYVETPLAEMIEKLHAGQLDLAVGEIGVSADRERLVDFTQPYLLSRAAVAIPRESWISTSRHILKGITHQGLVPVIAVMMGMLFLFSLLLWMIEKRIHQGHFGGRPIHGFGSALWFGAVTMTTVGYGDKTPQSALGRLIAFVWMFLGILLVSAFTGSVASSLTLAELHSSITHVGDLGHFRNGVVAGSQSERLLDEAGIPSKKFPGSKEGLRALNDGDVTALASEETTLRYNVNRDYSDRLRVVLLPVSRLHFAIATRPGLPEFEAINVQVIATTDGPEWRRRVEGWLGKAVEE